MELDQPPTEQPVLNIVGKNIALGPLRHDLIPLYMKWINDFEVVRGLSILPPLTWESEEAWYESASRSRTSASFTVYERPILRPLGNCGLFGIDHKNRTAELGIMLGEKDCWGKGYGTEAVSLVLDYGFTGLGLHNIMLTVFSFNERAVRAYNKAGFHLIGRRRQAWRLGGQAYDVIYMDYLASEFESPVLRKLLHL